MSLMKFEFSHAKQTEHNDERENTEGVPDDRQSATLPSTANKNKTWNLTSVSALLNFHVPSAKRAKLVLSLYIVLISCWLAACQCDRTLTSITMMVTLTMSGVLT